jgi:hypothetical protein
MKYYLVKLLQLVGMTHVGVGLIYGIMNESGMRFELNMLMLGSALFYLGRFIEGRGQA